MPYFFSFIAGLNFSSSQSQTPPPDNRTIQNSVEDYVDEYVSKSIVELTPYDYIWFLLTGVNLCPSFYLVQFIKTTLISIFILGGLNLSLTQVQPQWPDNRTIQAVVKAHLKEFIGRYPGIPDCVFCIDH